MIPVNLLVMVLLAVVVPIFIHKWNKWRMNWQEGTGVDGRNNMEWKLNGMEGMVWNGMVMEHGINQTVRFNRNGH
jgi:hypothetical protein